MELVLLGGGIFSWIFMFLLCTETWNLKLLGLSKNVGLELLICECLSVNNGS